MSIIMMWVPILIEQKKIPFYNIFEKMSANHTILSDMLIITINAIFDT